MGRLGDRIAIPGKHKPFRRGNKMAPALHPAAMPPETVCVRVRRAGPGRTGSVGFAP